ncbi:MAG: PAS domain S-box protein [Candidatus Lokiarchaeota archaeon]|nr:PAS domain S-box protein [Candidatus Lokiarchaeota archaeon]MBD3338942.1 PAS domain S-box protein [Candidatus Lokiarchaeota archaeon]
MFQVVYANFINFVLIGIIIFSLIIFYAYYYRKEESKVLFKLALIITLTIGLIATLTILLVYTFQNSVTAALIIYPFGFLSLILLTLYSNKIVSKQAEHLRNLSHKKEKAEMKLGESLEQLNRSQIIFNALIEQSPVPMAFASPDGTIFNFNDACRELLGIEEMPELKPGRNLFEFDKPWTDMDEEGNPIPTEELPLALSLKGIKTDGKEIMCKRSDGSLRWELVHGLPVYDDNHNLLAGFIIFPDITKLKNIEKKLRESEEKYRLITENANDLIALLNEKYEHIFINESAYLKMLGYSKQDMLGKTRLDLVHPDDFRKTINSLKTGFEHGEGTVEIRLKHREGHFLWFEFKGTKFTDSEGNFIGLLIGRDITSRKEAKQRLKKSEEKYRNAYERENFYKDLFAHDMNNILQAMLMSLEMCKINTKFNSKPLDLPELIETYENQVKRAARLVENVLKFSEIKESGKLVKKVNLIEYLVDAINSLIQSVENKKINILREIEFEEIPIMANDLLTDVFENILHNAVKYNNNNVIEIVIKASKVIKLDKEFYKVEFIDNGVGIPDFKKKTIFNRGLQKERSVSGLGLGLSLVKNILDNYNSKIFVKNKDPNDYSKGSNFILFFPTHIEISN